MRTKITEAMVNKVRLPIDRKQQLVWDTDLTGFGLLVSGSSKSFVVKRRNVRKSIGRHPALSVAAARVVAMQRLAIMEEHPTQRVNRINVAQALADHIADMRKAGRSERSIEGMEYFISQYLGNWLNRDRKALRRLRSGLLPVSRTLS